MVLRKFLISEKFSDKNELFASEAKKVFQLINKFDQVLGLRLTKEKKEKIPEDIFKLAE